MKESVGYTVTLNIVITFIVIVFTFLSSTLIYYKSNKVSNVIMNSIEKYEGYNDLAQKEIALKMSGIGYSTRNIKCSNEIKTGGYECSVQSKDVSSVLGYCVYLCEEDKNDYYFYRVKTNMPINIPIINELVSVPIFSNTNRLYDFTK